MSNFYDNLDWDTARNLEALARLSLELREARAGVLRHYGIAHQDELRARILSGAVPEHPAWEHVLAMRILDDTREAVRGLIAAGGRETGGVPTLNARLRTLVERDCAADLAGPAALTQDALVLPLRNGLVLTVHYAAADDYALRWQGTDADGATWEAGIDTAPVHAALAPAPNHLHRADGTVAADPVTRCGEAPEANLRALLDALRADPRFGREG